MFDRPDNFTKPRKLTFDCVRLDLPVVVKLRQEEQFLGDLGVFQGELTGCVGGGDSDGDVGVAEAVEVGGE